MISISSPKLRVIVISSWARSLFFYWNLLHWSAECSASTVLMLWIVISSISIHIFSVSLILAWPWSKVKGLLLFSIFNFVSWTIGELRENIFSSIIKSLNWLIMRRSWISLIGHLLRLQFFIYRKTSLSW